MALCVKDEAEGWLLFEPMEVQRFHFVKLKRLHNQIHYFRHFQDSRKIPTFSILLSRPVETTNITQTLSITQCFVGQLQRFRGGWLARLQTHCYDLTVASLLSDTSHTPPQQCNVIILKYDEHIHTWSWTHVELTYLPLKRDN